MKMSGLSNHLQEDASQDVPPFGTESLRISRQLGASAASLLLEGIKVRGNEALLTVEALRESDPDTYNLLPAEERAECYVDALLTNIFYNTWGLPGYQLSATSRALISLGEKAVAALKPLLCDRRFAPHSGSKDATASNVYGNRVCDYAWVFISEIMHRPYAYSQSPAERDLAIDELRASL
jgi:hypothetical protein